MIIAYAQAQIQRKLQYIAKSAKIDAKKKLLTVVQYNDRVECKRGTQLPSGDIPKLTTAETTPLRKGKETAETL